MQKPIVLSLALILYITLTLNKQKVLYILIRDCL